MTRFLLVCLGGAAGTGARYLIALWLPRAAGSFPYATFTVNVLGSFLLGVLAQVGSNTTLLSSTTRLVLATGVMGGFTTYSAFNQETLEALRLGAYGAAGLYVTVTLLSCLGAGLLGLLMSRALVGN